MTAQVATSIAYCSYAKINLYLRVLDRRKDGYHNIETIFQTVDLCDRLEFEIKPDAIALTCNDPNLEPGPGNLVHRAATLLKHRCRCRKGVEIRLEKNIPIAGGLAGGSGNAAATLAALNELWELGLAQTQIRTLAEELGADVPYCCVGGTVAGTGRGDRLTVLNPIPETWFVLVQTGLQVSTAAIFNHPELTRSAEEPEQDITPSLKRAIYTLNRGTIADMAYNGMEKVVFAQHPELAGLKKRLIDAGCTGALMSGSGPTLFGVCRSREQAAQIAGTFTDVQATAVRSVPHSIKRVD